MPAILWKRSEELHKSMSRIRVLSVALVILAISLASVTFAQDKTVAELVAEMPELSTFNTLATQAGLNLTGTVYAPTDEAFAAWPQFVTDYVTANPELLASILNYHVAADSSQLTIATAEDGTVTVDNATVTTADLAASDGTLSIVDTVLVPEITLPEVIAADVTGNLVLADSSTVFPISQTIAADFAAEGFAGEITADSIGTGAGFERFCAAEGASDIANASREIKDSEIESCEANNQRVAVGFRVGDDGLAVVVNPANDWATDLTTEQLALAFSTAATWADVDPSFPACDIQRWSPGTDSGTFDFFVESVLEDDSAPLLAASNLNLSEDDNILLDGVASNECAIGYFGFAYYTENAERVKLLAIDGVAPSAETVNGSLYGLARPMFIYTAPSVIAEKPQVGDFVIYYLNRVSDVTPSVGYFLPSPFEFNQSKLVLLAMLNADAAGGQ